MENVGPRSATLRPHIPRAGRLYGFATQKGRSTAIDCNHDYMITIKEKCVNKSELVSGQVSAVHMSSLNEKEANGEAEELYSFER